MEHNRDERLEMEVAFLREASHNHLERAKVLQETEWKVAFTLWSAVAAATALSITKIDVIAAPLLQNAIFVAIGSQIMLAAYLFGFCKNNHVSLTTERNRYQYFQNTIVKICQFNAAYIIGAKKGSEPQNRVTSGSAFLQSDTWGFKALTTTSLVNSSFLVVFWTAVFFKQYPVPLSSWVALAIPAATSAYSVGLAFSGRWRRWLRWRVDGAARLADRRILLRELAQKRIAKKARANRPY